MRSRWGEARLEATPRELLAHPALSIVARLPELQGRTEARVAQRLGSRHQLSVATARREVQEVKRCTHERDELRRRRIAKIGKPTVVVLQRQCANEVCGRERGPAVEYPEQTDVPWWKPRKRPTARKRAYNARFKQRDWTHEIRPRILERDGYLCQLRFGCCTERATQVHHITYERFGQERDTDLCAACAECNVAEREARH